MSNINYHIGAGAELQRQRDDALNRLAHVAGEAQSLRVALAELQQEYGKVLEKLQSFEIVDSKKPAVTPPVTGLAEELIQNDCDAQKA